MSITREDFEQRREALSSQRQESLLTLSAIDGAMQDVEFFLSVLNDREEPAAAEQPKPKRTVRKA